MEVYRESFSTIRQSPPRQVFGIHPTNGKILVSIDLCILVFGDPTPNFGLSVVGKNILDTSTSALVGTVKSFSVPPAGNINPIVTLNPDRDIDPSIKKIIVPSAVAAGDTVTLAGDPSFTGNVLASSSSSTSLIDTFPFPLDPGRNVLAFKVKFSTALGLEDIGSPIVRADGTTLGMLLTAGKTVFVYPSSSIDS